MSKSAVPTDSELHHAFYGDDAALPGQATAAPVVPPLASPVVAPDRVAPVVRAPQAHETQSSAKLPVYQTPHLVSKLLTPTVVTTITRLNPRLPYHLIAPVAGDKLEFKWKLGAGEVDEWFPGVIGKPTLTVNPPVITAKVTWSDGTKPTHWSIDPAIRGKGWLTSPSPTATTIGQQR